MAFKFAYNTSGRPGQPRIYPIATATAIEKGEMIKKTSGLVVAIGDTDQDDPIGGVSAENHDGSASGRDSGLEIKIYDHPEDVFSVKPREVITATGGSTTTFVDSNLQFANDDDLNGGYLHIVSCAANSALNGKVIKISDYAQSSGTITLSETLSDALAASDTAYLCPGPIAKGSHNWNLNSDGTDISWEDSSAGEALELYDVDPDNFLVFFKLRLHLLGNQPVAI